MNNERKQRVARKLLGIAEELSGHGKKATLPGSASKRMVIEEIRKLVGALEGWEGLMRKNPPNVDVIRGQFRFLREHVDVLEDLLGDFE